MQATRKSAGEEYNKYVSHLKSVVTVVNGQLHYLNSRLRDIISNEDIDINTRYYQASSLYAQMLRLFYVIDRIHNYSDSNLTKESSNIDFIAGSASLDLVDFVDQCRHLDHHINKVNEGYLAKGKVQKAAVNQTIIDQSILWITQNNKDLVKSNISVQKFFLDSNYQSSLESLDPSESLKDKPTMKAYMEQQKNDAWQFILSNLRDAFCQDYIDTGIYPAKFSDIKMTNAISYRDFLKGAEQDITLTKLPLELSNLNEPEKLRVLEEKVTALGFDVSPEVLGNLVKNSSFKSYYVKNYMLNRTNKPYLQGIVKGLEDSYMNTVLDKISSDFDGVISEVAESSMYTLDEFSESKINYSFTDPETSGHFRFEKTACSFLSHLQISALSKNLEQKYGSDIYDSGKILREFSISDSNISSTKIDRNKYNFFMAIINETEFLRDSGYDFYVSLYKMNKEDRSELLESAADYLKSPGFLSRLQWISQMEVVAANSGDRDKRRFYKRFSEVLKMYAYAVKKVNLNVENNSKMLSKQQYMDEFTNDQDYINLHLYNSSFANFTYYYDKPSLKSLVDMDRYSYRTSMPINGVEQITTFIEGGGILDTLPVEVRSMIVSDYLLFEQRYVWQEDSHILANVLRQIDNASSKHDSEKAKINYAITNFENNDFQMDDSVIFKAIKDDDYRYLRVLLENNVSLVAKNEEGLNPLEYAI
ncbi:MAG: hypothetical protein VX335_05635 [Pseudomonadota bacterium]|nr:hypothetical protein [Pseudomonadota bacterium]